MSSSLESSFFCAFAEIDIGSTKIRLLQEAGYEAIDELNREWTARGVVFVSRPWRPAQQAVAPIGGPRAFFLNL